MRFNSEQIFRVMVKLVYLRMKVPMPPLAGISGSSCPDIGINFENPEWNAAFNAGVERFHTVFGLAQITHQQGKNGGGPLPTAIQIAIERLEHDDRKLYKALCTEEMLEIANVAVGLLFRSPEIQNSNGPSHSAEQSKQTSTSLGSSSAPGIPESVQPQRAIPNHAYYPRANYTSKTQTVNQFKTGSPQSGAKEAKGGAASHRSRSSPSKGQCVAAPKSISKTPASPMSRTFSTGSPNARLSFNRTPDTMGHPDTLQGSPVTGTTKRKADAFSEGLTDVSDAEVPFKCFWAACNETVTTWNIRGHLQYKHLVHVHDDKEYSCQWIGCRHRLVKAKDLREHILVDHARLLTRERSASMILGYNHSEMESAPADQRPVKLQKRT